MSVFEHWQMQKAALRPLLNDQTDMAGVVYQVRHAVLQTEQNALAEMNDDVLRQQAGVLMSCIKNSVGLLEAHISAQTWLPQKQQTVHPKGTPWQWVFAGLMLLCAAGCILSRLWFGAMMLAAAGSAGMFAFFQQKKQLSLHSPVSDLRITLKPDPEKLFAVLDGQMRAADRYLNDYAYLNEQLRGSADNADPALVSRAAELMEALYECDDAPRDTTVEAARKLLEHLGLRAVDYAAHTSKLFNVLPSKNTTRTLTPAILSVKEQRLLKRGTAAARIDAAPNVKEFPR